MVRPSGERDIVMQVYTGRGLDRRLVHVEPVESRRDFRGGRQINPFTDEVRRDVQAEMWREFHGEMPGAVTPDQGAVSEEKKLAFSTNVELLNKSIYG